MSDWVRIGNELVDVSRAIRIRPKTDNIVQVYHDNGQYSDIRVEDAFSEIAALQLHLARRRTA